MILQSNVRCFRGQSARVGSSCRQHEDCFGAHTFAYQAVTQNFEDGELFNFLRVTLSEIALWAVMVFHKSLLRASVPQW